MGFLDIRVTCLLGLSIVLNQCSGFSPSVYIERKSYGTSLKPFVTPRNSSPALHMADTTKSRPETFDLPDDDENEKGASSNVKQSGISSSELRWTNDMTELRRVRLENEEEKARRFVLGDALHTLRQKVLGLRMKLKEARERSESAKINRLSRSILRAQQMDAEFIYQVSLERMEAATRAGLKEEAENYRREAMLARSALPQFNMEGLWIGRFGEEFQMVNISYTGDVLIARKVTGNKNVPKGQISFEVDLSPKNPVDVLEPIELNDESAKQWGCRFLQRFSGRGQVASPGYRDSEWLEGQLIMVDKYFSFAWLPIAHQVFFGRPSAELTLKMLRQNRASSGINTYTATELTSDNKSDVEQMRVHLTRCWEETEHMQDELDVSDGIFKSHDQLYYYDQVGCFE